MYEEVKYFALENEF